MTRLLFVYPVCHAVIVPAYLKDRVPLKDQPWLYVERFKRNLPANSADPT